MARPCKIPKDPRVYNELLENMALGLPVPLIAATLKINENTIHGWKRRSDFKADLAVKTLEILKGPVQKIHQTTPLVFLQTHPETREAFAPPKERREMEIKGLVLGGRDIEDLIAIAQRGSNRSSDNSGED